MPKMNKTQQLFLIQSLHALIFAHNINTIQNAQIDQRFRPWILYAQGRTFKNSVTQQRTLRGFDITLDIDEKDASECIKPKRLRLIEQNPDKRDGIGNLKPLAELARQGNQISWLINQDLEDGFIGKIVNGTFEPVTRPLLQRPTQTANPRTGEDQFGIEHTLHNGEFIPDLQFIPESNIDALIPSLIEESDADGDSECQFDIDM